MFRFSGVERNAMYLSVAAAVGSVVWLWAIAWGLAVTRLFPEDSRVGIAVMCCTPVQVVVLFFLYRVDRIRRTWRSGAFSLSWFSVAVASTLSILALAFTAIALVLSPFSLVVAVFSPFVWFVGVPLSLMSFANDLPPIEQDTPDEDETIHSEPPRNIGSPDPAR